VKDTPTGDDILDEAITIMKDQKDATVEDWIKNLNGTLIFKAGIKNLQERVYQRLVAKKVVRVEEKKVQNVVNPFALTFR
jgi:hypothetical protein